MHILLIGCGKMGGALLKGMLAAQLPWHYSVVEHHTDLVTPFLKLGHVEAHTDLATVTKTPDIIILAVKPQMMSEVLQDLESKILGTPLVISIAAGKNLTYLRHRLPSSCTLIRTMPNTPGSLGAGMTVAVAEKPLSSQQQQSVDQVLSSLGKCVWITDETLMDAVTALSGSGPAYLFLLCEVMAKAGQQLGLPQPLADQLARETIIGSALLLQAESTKTPASLREAVTSPKGTTAAALEVLMGDHALETLLHQAMQKAADRSKELARNDT